MNRREFMAAAATPAFAQTAGVREPIHAHIDNNLQAHIEAIQQYVRQPSVSAVGQGIPECAELTMSMLHAAGCQETEVLPTNGHPAVWGRLDSGASKTILVYWMYDVQPAGDKEWLSPPFEARVVDAPAWGAGGRILRGRGAANQKGPERAFLNAMESIRAVAGKLPVNLLFICEGEEELGSPNLPQIVAKLKPKLSKATGVLFPSVIMGRDGTATLTLGNKGIAYIELECRGGAKGGPSQTEIHSSAKGIADSPVWRLVQALATLTDKTGNQIEIDGVRDRVRKPNAREMDLFETYLKHWDEAAAKRSYQLHRWIDGVGKREALRRLWFEPSLNIDGIWAGYTGPGSKTVLPPEARVKIDFRLVPDQKATEIVPLLRKHLDKRGFDDVVVKWWNGYDPSQSDPDSAIVRAAVDVCSQQKILTRVSVRQAGSAPHYLSRGTCAFRLLHLAWGTAEGRTHLTSSW